MACEPMKLWLAEYGAVNPDGTFTVIRGGIENWKVGGFPFDLLAYLLIEVEPGGLGTGNHPFRVSVRDPAGALACEIVGSAHVLAPNDRLRACFGVIGKVNAPGDVHIQVKMGELETATLVVNVSEDSRP